MIYKSLQNLKS